MIQVSGISKTFTLHNQGGARIDVLAGGSFAVAAGECVALTGVSGAGKSTLMRMIYGNYLVAAGSIMVGDLDVVRAEPREILALRRHTLRTARQHAVTGLWPTCRGSRAKSFRRMPSPASISLWSRCRTTASGSP